MRKLMIAGFLVMFSSLLLTSLAFANNIIVSNVTLTSQSTANKTVNVQFDISWQNSWRLSYIYDAA
ncbi:MAG: hypothetical protein HQL22_11955, partial [Candidatus Omnitrophica bacterium]|nr:hypothetical protein [Candidatus Omnitrophota bacterium]